MLAVKTSDAMLEETLRDDAMLEETLSDEEKCLNSSVSLAGQLLRLRRRQAGSRAFEDENSRLRG